MAYEENGRLEMKQLIDWFCPQGCNVFGSSDYSLEGPPECASCGASMTADSTGFDDVHEAIERREIAEIETNLAAKFRGT